MDQHLNQSKIMNEIAKTKNNFIPITEIMSIGKAFVESGMFPDVKTAAQAIVKIQAGQELGIAPFSSMTGIHIIQGRPTVGAGIIAAKIKGSEKYDYKVVKHDETICSVDIYEAKKVIGNSSFTIEDAKRAQTKNLDKYPKNMLFARAISNAVKWFCPDVFSGPVYTPEEMESVTEDTTFENVDPVQDAIQKLSKCDNVEELSLLRDTLEKEIVDNKAFREAATARFYQLKLKTA